MQSSNLQARKRGPRYLKEDVSSTTLESADDDTIKESKWRHIISTTLRSARVMSCAIFLFVVCIFLRSPYYRTIVSDSLGFQEHRPPRYVVVVDSGSEVNPAGRHKRLESIHATWGPAARAIFVVNNITEYPEASHAILSNENEHHPSYPRLLPLPPEVLPDRSIPALQYTIRNILNLVNPDFALFTNDHTYVLDDHLCTFLENRSPDQHMYAGHALRNGAGSFQPASSGYILSRHSMETLVQKWDEKDLICSKPTQGNHAGLLYIQMSGICWS